MLRHFHAVRALVLGAPLNDIQPQLRHADLKTTSVYLYRNQTPADDLRGVRDL